MSEVKPKGKKEKDKGGAEGKKGNLLKIILVVFLAIAVVGGGAFGGYYFATKNTPSQPVKIVEVPQHIDESLFGLDEAIVNLANQDVKKYLKVNIYVAYDKKAAKTVGAEITEKKAILRDVALNVLRNKKAEDITAKGEEDIKKEIVNRINGELTSGKATNVYFYDLLIQ